MISAAFETSFPPLQISTRIFLQIPFRYFFPSHAYLFFNDVKSLAKFYRDRYGWNTCEIYIILTFYHTQLHADIRSPILLVTVN